MAFISTRFASILESIDWTPDQSCAAAPTNTAVTSTVTALVTMLFQLRLTVKSSEGGGYCKMELIVCVLTQVEKWANTGV